MRSNLTFRLSAQNSLKVTELPKDQGLSKNALNTFKGGNDLRHQLDKSKPIKNKTLLSKNNATSNFERQLKKSEQQALAQQVASLDHFKPAVTRDKTKNLIESIKLRRRQKHIDTLNRFREDLQDYKQNLSNIYSSLVSDLEQVMGIKQSSIYQYLQSMTEQYLLSRQGEVLDQIRQQTNTYKIQSQTKLNDMGTQLQNLKQRRGDVVSELCAGLRQALIQIAFVLESQAIQIQNKQKKDIQEIQEKYYEKYKGKYEQICEKQKQRNQRVSQKSEQVLKKWKQIKQKYQLDTYITDAQSERYRRPQQLRNLYDAIIKLQQKNHNNKLKILKNLVNEDPDTFLKSNIEKWKQIIKKANQYFDNEFDDIIAQFMRTRDTHRQDNNKRAQYCKNRLKYIQNHNQQEIQQIMKQKIEPLRDRNINQQQKMIKDMTDYVQKQDDRQNKVFQQFSKFIGKIAQQNDKFIKDFGQINQKYEIQKAKVLDQDEQTIDKLTQELNNLKQQLRQALHHIKLEQIQELCFSKVDQIQKAYRNCHQQNKKLQETRKPTLQQFMVKYQAKIAELMMLYGPDRKAQLQEKNKADAEQQATKRYEKQQKKKAQEQARLIQEAKAKGGKPPAPAKKDPKKAAAQMQERKKAILAQIGTKNIQEFTTQAGNLWLVYKNIQQICQSFYKQQEKPEQQNKQQGQNNVENKIQDDQQNKKSIDAAEDEIKDHCGLPVVNNKSFIQISQLIPFLSDLRQKIFDSICQKRDRILRESDEADEQMLEQSLVMLDNRLKAHYSMKGQIQSEIYVKRSGQITGHKKKYEKYARNTKQKMDLQTQKFNFLLQKGLQLLKNHNTQQKSMKEHIPKCKNLSELQGMYSRTRENYNSFGLTIKQIYGQLDRLSSHEVDILLQKNQDFIKQSKIMDQGGDYSNDEINWYQDMLNQITNQIKEQQTKRKQKYQELKQHSQKKRKQLLQAFQKQYHLTVQQLSARDGTGKKYGKPKRIAQQKTRYQMNKCQQAQINIDQMIHQIAKQYQIYMKNDFKCHSNPPTLEWRKKLMTIYTCITRYGKHIEAFKSDLKITEMLRINYNQELPQCKLTPQDEQQDKKRKQQELKALGKLSQQKDDRIFMKYIEEIQKIIGDESRNIYTGDKAKFLTGNDKIPDFLRNYIKNMKNSAEDFRLASIRELRDSCSKLTDLSKCISQLYFSTMETYSIKCLKSSQDDFIKNFNQLIKKHKQLRANHLHRLRPNLKNPKCQQQLKKLDQQQKNRNQQYQQSIQRTEKQFKDTHYKQAECFLNKLLNNYQFLILYIDSLYLFEDFVTVPGDQTDNKTHLNVQKLMVMKQKGVKIDPTSQRNLKRKWEGFDYTVFDIQDRKFTIKKIAQEQPKEKDKKAGKKDSKDPKKQQEQVPESDPSKTKTIETFKTWRQKSVYECQNRTRNNFGVIYKQILEKANILLQNDKKENNSYEVKWRETADSLYLS